VSEMGIGKGSAGVWNGTAVKLFRVQETAPEGPSLLAPRVRDNFPYSSI